ncbi:hypothetical protein CEXT_339121 [Caerostris extrusa]|uniref:Uncharacterized protein n=1 Tax=Caerostris extrusa TaxID=172846 RepID=A0AAV4VDW3_CAEEX|nr:hypothetical protein CEXT_339121 [Caerostris extrusa]
MLASENRTFDSCSQVESVHQKEHDTRSFLFTCIVLLFRLLVFSGSLQRNKCTSIPTRQPFSKAVGNMAATFRSAMHPSNAVTVFRIQLGCFFCSNLTVGNMAATSRSAMHPSNTVTVFVIQFGGFCSSNLGENYTIKVTHDTRGPRADLSQRPKESESVIIRWREGKEQRSGDLVVSGAR